MGILDKLKQGLSRTAQHLVNRFDDLVRSVEGSGSQAAGVDTDTADTLEEILIGADVGVAAAREIVDAVTARARSGQGLRALVKA
jgi:signal recognition particle GTPase